MKFELNQKGTSFLSAMAAGATMVGLVYGVTRGITQNVRVRAHTQSTDLFQKIEKATQTLVMNKMNQFFLEAAQATPVCDHSAVSFTNVFSGTPSSSGLDVHIATIGRLAAFSPLFHQKREDVVRRCLTQQTFMTHGSFAQSTDYSFCLILQAENELFLGEFHYARKDLATSQAVSCDHTYERTDRNQASLTYTLHWEKLGEIYSAQRSYVARGYNAVNGLNPTDQLGLLDTNLGRFYLNSRKSEAAQRVVTLASPISASAMPVAGDWNGDGTDGIGYFDQGKFYLKEEATSGTPEKVLDYPGTSHLLPVSGNWGSDKDGIGLYDPSQKRFYLMNTQPGGHGTKIIEVPCAPDSGLPFGNRRFHANGSVLGIYDSKTGSVCLINNLDVPACDTSITLRAGSTYVPFSGDWYGDGFDRVALFDSFLGRWQFWFEYTSPASSRNFGPAPSTMKPFAGRWNAS